MSSGRERRGGGRWKGQIERRVRVSRTLFHLDLSFETKVTRDAATLVVASQKVNLLWYLILYANSISITCGGKDSRM